MLTNCFMGKNKPTLGLEFFLSCYKYSLAHMQNCCFFNDMVLCTCILTTDVRIKLSLSDVSD